MANYGIYLFPFHAVTDRWPGQKRGCITCVRRVQSSIENGQGSIHPERTPEVLMSTSACIPVLNGPK